MSKTGRIILILVLYSLYIGIAYCEAEMRVDSEQYKLAIRLEEADEDPYQLIEQIIALDAESNWAGWAFLEKAKLMIAEAEKDSFVRLKKFTGAESMILDVIYNYGGLVTPVSGTIRYHKGMINFAEEILVEELVKKVPICLEHSARFELAALYIKMQKEREALKQLQILIEDGTLMKIKTELDNRVMRDFWYPQQKALMVKFQILWEAKKSAEAKATKEMIDLFGNPRDIEYVNRMMDSEKDEKKDKDKDKDKK